MEKKVFSVLFALVLAVSLNLVMATVGVPIVSGAEFPSAPPAESGVLPTWALVVIVVGAAIISGWVFWFVRKK